MSSDLAQMAKDATEEDKPHLQAFLMALAQLNTLEISWAFNNLADHARERLKELEEAVIRHERFKRPEEAKKALAQMEYQNKILGLRDLWKEAEMEYSAPYIVAAVTGRDVKKKPPSRKVDSKTT